MTTPARTTLERRRDKAEAAQETAEKARAGVTELDHRLETNADLTRRQEQALRTTVAETNRLKRVLKNAADERKRLTKQRRKATSRVQKASGKADTAEAKYDKSVLADLVAREKQRDRNSSVTPPAVTPPAASKTEAADPQPEVAPAATSTAVRTAARKTATRAGTTSRTTRTRRAATS